jgi:hypothetical protein
MEYPRTLVSDENILFLKSNVFEIKLMKINYFFDVSSIIKNKLKNIFQYLIMS